MASAEVTKSEIARGEALFKSPCTFVKGVVAIDGLPEDGRHEVAFAGRSNVGKSSLINALAGRKSLARVSVTPGTDQRAQLLHPRQGCRIPSRRHARLRLCPGVEGRRSRAGRG